MMSRILFRENGRSRNHLIKCLILIVLVSAIKLRSWTCSGMLVSHHSTTTATRATRLRYSDGCNHRFSVSLYTAADMQGFESTDKIDPTIPLYIHHTAVKTRNITTSIQFYSLLGFEVSTKFRAGAARAAWLEQKGQKSAGGCRLELIEVPSYMLKEPEGMKRRAIDLIQRQDMLGYNHLALDVTESMRQMEGIDSLSDWIDELNIRSVNVFGKTLRIALTPQQKIIGNGVYELAFLYDADGALVELLRKESDLEQQIESGWEPLAGQSFDLN